MQQIILVIHLLIALSLIAVVLVQRNESGAGLGGLGGGGGGAGAGGMAGFMSGRSQANLLTRVTAGLALAFFVTSIVLAILAHQASDRPSLFDQPIPGATTEEPADTESAPTDSGTDAPSVPLSE